MSVAQKIRTAENLLLEMSRRSVRDYMGAVLINAGTGPKRFGDAADPWQLDLLKPKLRAIEALAGHRNDYTGPWSFMSILARGHDKSSLEGRICTWLLLASKRPIHGYILAADRDQGRLILQAMQDEYNLNAWLHGQITFTKNVVTGPGGFVEVLPCDAASSYGLRGNLYIADEFTHWKREKEWTAMISGREKVDPSLLIVLSNAGLLGTWQHDVRTRVEHDDDWVLFERRGQLATWMNRERIEKMRLLLPPSEGRRLYDNVWIDPVEDLDYLRREEVEACAELGRRLGLRGLTFRSPVVSNYVGSLDYGPRKDRTVFTILHEDADRRVIVDRMDVWQGSGDNPVSIRRVEDHLRDLHRTFRPKTWVVDEYQMAGTIEALTSEGIPVERFAARGGQANYEAAQWLRQRIVNRTIAWYDGCGAIGKETLVDELAGLRVKRMSYGYRFDHENQKHDDRAVALCMAGLRSADYPDQGGPIEIRKPRLRSDAP